MPTRVYIVEDHPVMREMLCDYLAVRPEIQVCGMAPDADAAEAELQEARAQVVLLDVSLPGRSGLDLLEVIVERWGTPCLMLSGHGERSYITRALAAGARGYLLKGSPAELPRAIQAVAGGGTYVSAAIRDAMELDPEDSGT